jgi:putative tryptophan/tyrosine transport system substrate-binding protein
VHRRRALSVLAAFGAGFQFRFSSGDERGRIKRIGFHGTGSAQSLPGALDAFRQGMAALGWVDGRDYFIDARHADNQRDAIDQIAAQLIAANPDVLLAPGDSSTRALARKTKTIPIVFAISSDPVGAGYAASLQRPGANITGVTSFAPVLAAKRLQLLREVYPRARHIGLLFNPSEAQSGGQVAAYEQVAAEMSLRVSGLEIRQTPDIAPAVKRGIDAGVGAFVLTQGPLINTNRPLIAEALLRVRRPAITPFLQDADAGILMAYAPSIRENFRLAASYVHRILKGARPGDLAIEQPTKLELVINLRTAKALGLTIPAPVLLRADRLIE